MKIAKYLNHLGVDTMLKNALGDDLTIFRWNDPTPWIGADSIRFSYQDGDISGEDWDIFMFDDMMTVHFFKLSGARAKNYVWYCHGSFTHWPVAQEFFNKYFPEFRINSIFTDDHKRTLVDEWRTFDIEETITIPIALDSSYHVPVSENRNGRIAIIGNDYNKVCQSYPRYQSFVEPAIQHVMDEYHDLVDVYGYNDDEPNDIFGDCRRGPARIKDLHEYSVSLHLSGVASIGFVLMECFAAGIPVLATAKYQLPDDDSWLRLKSLDHFKQALGTYLQDPALCRDQARWGQLMIQERFSLSSYRDRLITWLQHISS